MKDWQIEFRAICEEMKRNNETEKSLQVRGKITWRPDVECPNCGSIGTFYGDNLEYGPFYECASACYCPSCKEIYEVIEGRNFAPWDPRKFLPIMKNKLMANPEFLQLYLAIHTEFWPEGAVLTRQEKSCPVCGGDTYTFYKDLGGIDYYDNYWRVCINPVCNWPGVHWENYDSGF